MALSTAIASLGIPDHAYQAIVYNPSEDFRMNINPAILDVVFYDASSSAGARYEKASGTSNSLLRDMTDRDIGNGTGTALDSSTTSDFLYLRVSENIGGLRIVIGSANSTANTTLLVTYRKTDDTWASLSITDGTASGGVALAQTGSVTWTAPSDWKNTSLYDIEELADTGARDESAYKDAPKDRGMWIRIAWDEALDSDTEIDDIWTLNAKTDRGYFRSATEYALSLDRRASGAIEAILASGTDTLQVTWMRVAGV